MCTCFAAWPLWRIRDTILCMRFMLWFLWRKSNDAHTPTIASFLGRFGFLCFFLVGCLLRRLISVHMYKRLWNVGALSSKSETSRSQLKVAKFLAEASRKMDGLFLLHNPVSSLWMSLPRRCKIFFRIFLIFRDWRAIDDWLFRPMLRPSCLRDFGRQVIRGLLECAFSTT